MTFPQYAHPDDTSCTLLPDTRHFIQLLKTSQPRSRVLIRRPTELITPIVHRDNRLHIHEHSVAFANSADTDSPAPSNVLPDIFCQDASHPKTHDHSANGKNFFHIEQILTTLHAQYPTLDYFQYEDRLQNQGISYLDVASTFDANFYITSIGMVPDAAYLFCHWVAKELKRMSGGGRQSKNGEDVVSQDRDHNDNKKNFTPV